MLEVRDLVCRYGKVEALKGISLSVKQGQFVALIGANGAGKSTTLRAISGVLPSASGQLLFEGKDMSAHGPMPRSAWSFPTLAVAFFAIATLLNWTFTHSPMGLTYAVVVLVILFGTVFAAVHHAEVIAQRVGEPYGTLVLTMRRSTTKSSRG